MGRLRRSLPHKTSLTSSSSSSMNRNIYRPPHRRGGPPPTPQAPPTSHHRYPQRGGFGSHDKSSNNRRFVSELKLTKSEDTLSKEAVAIQEPCEIACYSRLANGAVHFDDRNLRLFRRLITEDIGTDLNDGFDTFTDKKDLGSQGYGDFLASIRNKKIPLQDIHFVTYRNNLNKIMATPYMKREAWEMGVHKRKGVVYLDVHKLPERLKSELDRRRCYWGYSFESLATEDPTRADGKPISNVDANVEFCSVVRTYVAQLDYRSEKRFEKEKLLKFWIQSFLAGVPYIVIGFRDDRGRLVRTERLRTKDITQRVKMKGYWQGGVCLAFTNEVLCWLYGTVKENEDYILQYAPPSYRLELLQASSCPDEITDHVEQL